MPTRTPVLRLFDFQHCKVPFFWLSQARRKDTIARLRRIALDKEAERNAPTPLWEKVLAAPVYLASSARQILIAWRAEGKGTRQVFGTSDARQLMEIFQTALFYNLPPRVYYVHRLFLENRRNYASQIISHDELQFLMRILFENVNLTVLDDKLEFFHFCMSRGIPTSPITAAFDKGHEISHPEFLNNGNPKQDLFSKPAGGYASDGVECWVWDTGTYRNGELSLGFDDLKKHLAQMSMPGAVLLQPRLRNHPSLAPISGNALSNYRILTGRWPDGKIEVIHAALRMGTGTQISSDNPVRMFCCAVDLKTGILGAAETKTPADGRHTHHPDSGAQIDGFVVTDWAEMVRLTQTAHKAIAEIPFIAWDVVHTEQGILLLEGNSIWGGNLAQMAGNLPLGLTRFPDIFLAHYERLNQPA